MSAEKLPTPDEVIALHEEVEREYDLTYTGSRVAAPRLELREIRSGAASHDDLYMQAAYLLRQLITDHIFEDGNKRTAWLTTQVFLERHGTEPAETGEAVERILKRIRRYDVDEIAEWLESGTLDRSKLDP